MVNVFITAPGGAYIFGIGQREYGESVEVEPDVATELLSRPGFSLDDPHAPHAPQKQARVNKKEDIADVRSE